jgi:hypothetical protein
MDNGKASARPNVVSSSVRMSPPQRSFSTYGKPGRPPHISAPMVPSPASQTSTSQRRQNLRMRDSAHRATSSSVAAAGRQCWSKG